MNAPAPTQATEFRFKRLLPSLAVDVFLPIITFNALIAMGVSTLLAVTAGGVFPLISIARKYAKTKEIDALGAIVLFFLVVGTATSLISGSVFFAIVKDSFLTATFGLIILGTLAFGRPLTFQLIRQMVAAGNEAEYARWGKLYDEVPDFRRTQWMIAIVWSIAYIAEAALRVGLALVTTPAVVVNVSPFLAFGMTIALALWTRHVMLALRDRRLREAAAMNASSSPPDPSLSAG
jgi:intracellular septation protein A